MLKVLEYVFPITVQKIDIIATGKHVFGVTIQRYHQFKFRVKAAIKALFWFNIMLKPFAVYNVYLRYAIDVEKGVN